MIGIKSLIIGVDNIPSVEYNGERFDKVRGKMKSVLIHAGWNKDFVNNSVAIVPINSLRYDNLDAKSTTMPWWKGQKIKLNGNNTVETLLDALDNIQNSKIDSLREKPPNASVSNVFEGFGDVIEAKGVCDVIEAKIV